MPAAKPATDQPEIDPRWAMLAAPFRDDEIETLPKPYSKDSAKGNCKDCGGYHGLPAVHLSYVGHAGVTMRLNSVDPSWNWEPMALTPAGTPLWADGGLWIRLTVLGVTRLGFGDSQGKTGPNATKEIIGDALRNAAMRFGVGTYLWSKSEAAKATALRQGADVDEPAAQQDRQAETPPPVEPTPGGSRVLGAYAVMSPTEQAAFREYVQGQGWGDPRYFTDEQADALMTWASSAFSGEGQDPN